MQLVDKPTVVPGQCGFCGGASKEKYIDTEKTFEFFGAFYICIDCGLYIASLFGCMSPEYCENVKRERDEARGLLDRITLRNETQREIIANLYSLTGNTPPSLVLNSRSVPSSVDEQSFESEGTSTSGEGEKLGDREGETSKSSDEQGMADLRSDAKSSGFSLNF